MMLSKLAPQQPLKQTGLAVLKSPQAAGRANLDYLYTETGTGSVWFSDYELE